MTNKDLKNYILYLKEEEERTLQKLDALKRRREQKLKRAHKKETLTENEAKTKREKEEKEKRERRERREHSKLLMKKTTNFTLIVLLPWGELFIKEQ